MSIDAEWVMDQKRSPGLIEVPCMRALRSLAAQVPANEAVVELGAFRGRGTAILALGATEGNGAQVHTFDPWENGTMPEGYEDHAPSVADYTRSETRQIFDGHLENTGAAEHVTVHQSTAVDGAKSYAGPKVGLLWHDALHDYASVLADLKAWLPKTARAATVILHDVGDPNLDVLDAAEAAFTRTKALREKWDWEGREVHLWQKPDGNGWRVVPKRGFAIVRTR